MRKNEMELLGMIRGHDEPEKALMIAVEVILTYLKQQLPFEGQRGTNF